MAFRNALAAFLVAAVVATPTEARAQDSTTTGTVTTRHRVTVGGKTLSYTARAGLIPIRDNDAGDVRGNMFFVSYTLDRAPGQASRPLTFLWNGGPGSNSGLVHLLGFGPRRITMATGGQPRFSPAGIALVDNEGTWLEHSDLVFVDPIGTGYSRPSRPEFAAEFYQSRGDAESVAEFIRVYVTRHDAFDAPLFLAGESYGVTRCALVADALERRRTHVSGVIMIGLALPLGDMPEHIRVAHGLPTFTAAAFANRKLAPDLQRDLRTTLAAAERWASSAYAPALARRDSLSATEREAIASQLARFTGLPAGSIDRASLRVLMPQYTATLLASEHKVVGRYDSRLTGPSDSTEQSYDPTTDPSLKDILDRVSVIRYLRNVIGFRSDLFYQGPFGGGYPAPSAPRGDWMSTRWNGTAPADPQSLQRAMTANAGLRVFIACGWFDLVCDYYGNEYAAAHVPFELAGRVTVRSYGGGHAIYTDDTARLQMKRDVAAFIAGRSDAHESGKPATEITFDVRPIRAGGEVTTVQVRAEIRGTIAPNRRFSLQAPITYAMVQGIADRVEGLTVRDANGPVALTVENDPANPGGFPFFRHWRATRTVIAPVVVTYSMRPGLPKRGPQFDLYAHGGGISTGGMALYVVPEGLGSVVARVRWDVSQLAAGSVVASTYGEGNVDLTGPLDRIVQAYYAAGPLGRYSPGPASGYRAYWLGEPQFDAAKEMAWGYQAYEYMRRFYRDTTTPAYNVLVRALPGVTMTLGGTALQNSFMLAVPSGPRDTSKAVPRNFIAHEMGHMWVGELTDGGQGGTTWFNEGLNVFYTRLLLMRAGLIGIDEYGRDINEGARAYYANPYRNASADSLDRLGFSAGVGAGSAQNVPYTRGSLFFAEMDARIRAASGGARKLDDVVLPLLARRQSGVQLTTAMLIDALMAEVGPSARRDFDAIIVRGETIAPASGAFGPCFERRARPDTVGGHRVEGFEWVRAANSDERCRTW